MFGDSVRYSTNQSQVCEQNESNNTTGIDLRLTHCHVGYILASFIVFSTALYRNRIAEVVSRQISQELKDVYEV